jgi:hypothetical protein
MSHLPKTSSSSSLSLGQVMLLQGVIPIILIGIALPIGLIALVLALESAPIRGAVDHGELFLCASNAGFIGCSALIASRSDRAINSMIASIFVLGGIIVPGYVGWSVLTVQGLLDKPYSDFLAIVIGGGLTLLASTVGLVFVRLSYRPV